VRGDAKAWLLGAPAVNAFLRTHPWPYLNYHRPCFFPTCEIDAQGRRRKRYRCEDRMPPTTN
jgi:hypothetical protein